MGGRKQGAMACERHLEKLLAAAWLFAGVALAQDDSAADDFDTSRTTGNKSTEESDPHFAVKIVIICLCIAILLGSYCGYTVYTSIQAKKEQEEKEQRAQEMKNQPKQPAPPGWYAALDDASGRVFFHNTATKERCWKDPRTREMRRADCVYNLELD